MNQIVANPRSWPFSKPLEFLQKVKYGGAVGKLTAIAVAALLVVAVTMVSAWGDEIVHLAGLGIVLIIVVVAFWRIAKTIEKYPELGLMDGTEIVAYRRLELAAKHQPILPDSPVISDPKSQPVDTSPQEVE